MIVPTYNRSALLRRTLETLARQRLPAAEFEVIVADDGSCDDTAEVARSFAGRLRLRYVFQEDRGFRVAAVRNAGARLASSPVLAFLDCGTLAGPDFVRSHLAAHAGHDRRAVLGYCFGYQPPLDEIPGLAGVIAELEPEAVVQRYRDDPDFLDLRRGAFERVGSDVDPLAVPWIFFYGLNCSVSAGAFWQVGGFDESFRTWGGEDMELGYRLFHGGVPIAASHEAWTLEVPHERRREGQSPEQQAQSPSHAAEALRADHGNCVRCRTTRYGAPAGIRQYCPAVLDSGGRWPRCVSRDREGGAGHPPGSQCRDLRLRGGHAAVAGARHPRGL